jgi:hypothetical protein
MTALSRRSILASAAAIIPATIAGPAIAIPALAPAKPETVRITLPTDTKLIELWGKLENTYRDWHKYVNGPQRRAEGRYDKMRGPSPLWSVMPAKFKRYFSDDAVRFGDICLVEHKNPKHAVVVWYNKAKKKHAKELAVWDQKRSQAWKESGSAHAEGEQMRLYEKCWPVFDAIMRIRAQSTAGMTVKLKAVRLMSLDDHSDLDGFAGTWKSLRSDILAMNI